MDIAGMESNDANPSNDDAGPYGISFESVGQIHPTITTTPTQGCSDLLHVSVIRETEALLCSELYNV